MGLDMYLEKDNYIGANFAHRDVKLKIDCTIGGRAIEIDPGRVSSITERVGYWRKANAIHGWFVREIQGGKDECRRTEVEFEELQKLKKLCEQVLETKDPTPLPPVEGFFFGGTEINEDYWSDLKDTIKIIEILKDDGSYYYQASW